MKTGRNSPCPCGSGRKFKKCCLKNERGATGSAQEIQDAVGRLVAWMEGTRWDEIRNEVLVEHFAEFCNCRIEDFDPDTMLTDLDQDAIMAVYSFAMEDFFSSGFGPEEDNAIDAFLNRKGDFLGVRGREYLLSLRDSVPGFYEVVDVVPGHSVTLRDILRGGPDVKVLERSGSQQLLKWDVLAGRLLRDGTESCLSGGIYLFPREVGQEIAKLILRQVKELEKVTKRARNEPKTAVLDAYLSTFCPTISSMWLESILDEGPEPQIRNTDNEDLVLSETRLETVSGGSDAVRAGLDACSGLVRDGGEEAWRWVRPEMKKCRGKQQSLPGISLPGGITLGHLRLEGDTLVLETNSRERADAGQRLLKDALGELILSCSVHELDMDFDAGDQAGDSNAGDLPPDLEEELLKDFKDSYYEDWLNVPVPMLDNKTPRQASRSRKGRAALVELLKGIEQNEMRLARRTGLAPYDYSWLWETLGVHPHQDNTASTSLFTLLKKNVSGSENGRKDDRICLIKATLSDRQARVRGNPCRVFSVPAGVSLHDLAEAILNAFGFDLDHAFGFYDNLKKPYGAREGYELFTDLGEPTRYPGVKKTSVGSVFDVLKKKMLFLFDYGDEWRFVVQLTGEEQDTRKRGIELVESRGKAPSQYRWGDEE